MSTTPIWVLMSVAFLIGTLVGANLSAWSRERSRYRVCYRNGFWVDHFQRGWWVQRRRLGIWWNLTQCASREKALDHAALLEAHESTLEKGGAGGL